MSRHPLHPQDEATVRQSHAAMPDLARSTLEGSPQIVSIRMAHLILRWWTLQYFKGQDTAAHSEAGKVEGFI